MKTSRFIGYSLPRYIFYLAMMYEEVFLGELFTKGDRSIAFLS